MPRIDRRDARTILNDCGVYMDKDGRFPDWFTLSFDAKDALLEVAGERKYRAPIHRNGSRGRYWYEYLRRTADRSE